MSKVVFPMLAVCALIFVGVYFSNSSANSQVADQSAEARLSRVGQDTIVNISTESSEGYSNNDLNTVAAEKLGKSTLERFRHHMGNILEQMHSKDSAERIQESTVLSRFGDLNIISTRLKVEDRTLAIVLMGVKNSEFVRIICSSPNGAEVMIVGKCNDALKSQFGVSIASGANI